jgi:hypothetical protein
VPVVLNWFIFLGEVHLSKLCEALKLKNFFLFLLTLYRFPYVIYHVSDNMQVPVIIVCLSVIQVFSLLIYLGLALLKPNGCL